MAYELITAWNMSEGFQVLFVYANDITGGLLMRLILFGIYVVIAGGLYNSQKQAVGTGDFPQALAVGGFSTAVLTILLRLLEGALVDVYTLTVVIIVALASFVWFLFSKD